MADLETLWSQTVSELARTMDPQRFETWVRPLRPSKQEDAGSLVLEAQNQFICDFLDQHYRSLLLSTIRSLDDRISSVSFVPSHAQATVGFETRQPVSPAQSQKYQTPLHSFSPLKKTPLFPKYTFDSFVVGAGNEFAKSAARAVAEAPGKTKFNPLLFYGGVGLGKTHLIQAIGNYLVSQHPSINITYITSEEFYLAFIDAIKNNRTKDFSDDLRSSDVLLVDDIQFFAGKESTQEAFFYLFNSLYQNTKQIVLTSDLPPASLKGLQDRLVSRFQWGLCIDIQPPNLETRVAILKRKAESGNLNIPEDVLYYIAEKISSNIRELEGVIIRIFAYASMKHDDITLDAVRELLKDTIKPQKSHISIEAIIEAVCEYYHVPVNNLLQKNRRKEVALARQVAMYIAKSKTNHSLQSIGLNFGGRDHSTVVHAVSQIEKQTKEDGALARDIATINAKLDIL
jgi:chromosomal replication initiator protein